jgi:hypothetical protein
MEKDRPRQRFPRSAAALGEPLGQQLVVGQNWSRRKWQKYHSPGPWKCGWAWLHRRSSGKKLTGPPGRHRVGVSTLLKGGKICYLPRSAAISNDMV